MHRRNRRKRWWLLLIVIPVLLVSLGWLTFTERFPERERELRNLVQDQLEAWFPEQMTLPDSLKGFVPRSGQFDDDLPPQVILVHGLDEPGGIWDELVRAMDEAGLNAWEFRYPNDQAIDRSAELLGEYWAELDSQQPVVLVGHSMGGLVIRDFVSRMRHPVDEQAIVSGPTVLGLIQIATPNQGSEWARFRVWLELRELFNDIQAERFSLFAGLRDGTGAAKIDLRPDSAFLAELNSRPWPNRVPIRIIGGILAEPDPAMAATLALTADELGTPELADAVEQLWAGAAENIGDGAVPAVSLDLPEAPPAMLVPATHRGLLVTLPLSEGDPPAIAPTVAQVLDWLEKPESRAQ